MKNFILFLKINKLNLENFVFEELSMEFIRDLLSERPNKTDLENIGMKKREIDLVAKTTSGKIIARKL